MAVCRWVPLRGVSGLLCATCDSFGLAVFLASRLHTMYSRRLIVGLRFAQVDSGFDLWAVGVWCHIWWCLPDRFCPCSTEARTCTSCTPCALHVLRMRACGDDLPGGLRMPAALSPHACSHNHSACARGECLKKCQRKRLPKHRQRLPKLRQARRSRSPKGSCSQVRNRFMYLLGLSDPGRGFPTSSVVHLHRGCSD